jgi:4-amino-4-deoxy-L-arabinose transferase-like glycosyltransferase
MVIRRNSQTPPLVIALLLFAWGVMSLYADRSFFGHHDANGVWLGAAARNLAGYGPAEIGWAPILNRGPLRATDLNVYINHPPLVVWASALALTLFGGDELSLRWVSMASTLVAIAGFYVLCRRLFGERRGLLCVALFTLTPMILYFGRMPNHEPLSLAFLMPLAAMLVRRREGTQRLAGMLALATLAIWTAWASVFFVACFAVVGWLWKRGEAKLGMLALSAVALLTPALIMAVYVTQYPGTLDKLIVAWVTRTSNVVNADAVLSATDIAFTWGDYIMTTLVHLASAATLALLVLGAFGWVSAIRDTDRRRPSMLLALAAAGLAYILVFRQVSFLHNYYKIYLMPVLAISAHYAIVRAWTSPRHQRVLRPVTIGLLVPSLLAGALTMRAWINTTDDYMELRLATYLAEATRPEETIFTNLPFNPNLEYYAHRRLVADVSRAEAEAQTEGAAVYFSCAWVDPDATGVRLDPQQPSEGCTLVRVLN